VIPKGFSEVFTGARGRAVKNGRSIGASEFIEKGEIHSASWISRRSAVGRPLRREGYSPLLSGGVLGGCSAGLVCRKCGRAAMTARLSAGRASCETCRSSAVRHSGAISQLSVHPFHGCQYRWPAAMLSPSGPVRAGDTAHESNGEPR
jgi:hypothetical protein